MRTLRMMPEDILKSHLLNYISYGLFSHRRPVDVLKLCKDIGVDVFWKDMKSDVVLKFNESSGEASIFIKKGTDRLRLKFGIAHALGHLMMHEFDNNYHEDFQNQTQTLKQKEANAFAARLLIPGIKLLGYLEFMGGRFDKEIVPELALVFDVTEETMFYRINNLGWWKKPKPKEDSLWIKFKKLF